MMATDYTPNYNLDLYASTDKPNLRDQYNAAMGKIDTQMKKSADDVTNANANVLTLKTQMTEAQKDITALESTVETHGTQITSIQNTADGALSLAQTNEGDIADTQADVASLTSRVTAVEGTANKNKTDIASLDTRMGIAESSITQAKQDISGKAPTNHASAANTYGQGSPTNFGHLKVVDSGTASASTGTAASPQMVNAAIADMATVETATVNGNKINGAVDFDVTMNWNKALGIANFRFYTGFSQTGDIGETRLTAEPFPENMRPSSNRTLKSYAIVSMNSPAGSFEQTSTIPLDLVYKTDGHLYLNSLAHIGETQWTTLSTAQGVLFTQGW